MKMISRIGGWYCCLKELYKTLNSYRQKYNASWLHCLKELYKAYILRYPFNRFIFDEVKHAKRLDYDLTSSSLVIAIGGHKEGFVPQCYKKLTLVFI